MAILVVCFVIVVTALIFKGNDWHTIFLHIVVKLQDTFQSKNRIPGVSHLASRICNYLNEHQTVLPTDLGKLKTELIAFIEKSTNDYYNIDVINLENGGISFAGTTMFRINYERDNKTGDIKKWFVVEKVTP